MWFTETSWPPIVVCSLIGAYLLFKWWTTQRGLFLAICALLLGLSVGIYFVERAVVTEAEKVEAHVHQLAAAVVANDVPRVMSFFSPRADKIRKRVAASMATFTIRDDMRITDMQVEMKAENSLATSHFRANGTIVGRASNIGVRGATRWLLTWQRQAGEWKITDVVRLHPIRDNETLDFNDRPD